MKQLKWLESSLQAFFDESGVPKPLTTVLAERVSTMFFANVGDVVDAESYYQGLQKALIKVVRSDDYDYDLSAFISKSTIKDIRRELRVTSFTRAEIFNKSIELELLKAGIAEGDAVKYSFLVGDHVVRSEGFFNLSVEEAKDVIENALVAIGGVDQKTASDIAAKLNVEFVLYGEPLESIEAVRLLDTDEFKEILNARVESSLSEDLDQADIEEIKNMLNEVLFGSSDGEPSLGLSGQIKDLIESMTDGGDTKLMHVVYQHFYQFKFPSLEMYEYLNGFSKAGVLITKSLLDKQDETSDELVLRALSENRL